MVRYKVGFLSIVAVEWFVFVLLSVMASPLIQVPCFVGTGQPALLSHLRLREYSHQEKKRAVMRFQWPSYSFYSSS